MRASVVVAKYYRVALTQIITTYMHYDNTSDNTITHMDPGSAQNTDCNGGTTVSAGWFGFTVSSNLVTCGGLMSLCGLTQPVGGAHWNGAVNGAGPGNTQTVAIEPIMLDHTTYNNDHNPNSTWYLWTTSGSVTNAGGGCNVGNICGH
jgi:hypothetical protein